MQYELRHAEVEGSLEGLERRRWLFANLPIDPLHAGWLRRRTWVRTIHGTTRIEGNTLSDVEVEALLDGETGRHIDIREAREIVGSREALTLVDRLVDAGQHPNEAVIREVHRLVLWHQSLLLTPGEYRRGENRVVDPSGRLIFSTPPSGDVPALMSELGSWLAGAHHREAAPVAAALAHLELVAIHPFNDGNGRTARAVARMLLAVEHAFDGLVSLDAQLDLDRDGYFAAIRASLGGTYRHGYDATPFVSYFVNAIVTAADHVLGRLRGLGSVMVAIRRSIADGSLPPSMIDGLAFAWLNRHLRARDYIGITGRNAQGASRDLASAVVGGWLVATGERRGRHYLLGPRLLAIPSAGEIAG